MQEKEIYAEKLNTDKGICRQLFYLIKMILRQQLPPGN